MKFTLYSKQGCSYCKKAEKLLEIAKVEYRVYKLGTDFTKEQFISEFGLVGAAFSSMICALVYGLISIIYGIGIDYVMV